MSKRFLSVALALCILLTLLPAVSVPALAGAESYNVAMGIPLIDGGQDSNIYFGTYPQSSAGGSGYNTDPIKWRVLDDNSDYFSETSVADEEAFKGVWYNFGQDGKIEISKNGGNKRCPKSERNMMRNSRKMR